jgi:hypothetical protein
LSLSQIPDQLRRRELRVIRKFSCPTLCDLPELVAALSSLLKSRAALQLENLALRHQIGVLNRSN